LKSRSLKQEEPETKNKTLENIRKAFLENKRQELESAFGGYKFQLFSSNSSNI